MKHFEKCELFNSNLVLHARHFQHRVEIFFKEILLIPLSTIGKGSYYAIRIEFKVVTHCKFSFIWFLNPPKLSEETLGLF